MAIPSLEGPGAGTQPSRAGAEGTGPDGEPSVAHGPVLVLLLSAASVEGLRRVAATWTGPVLVVASAEEARAVLGARAPRPAADKEQADEDVDTGDLELDEDRQVVAHGGAEAPLTPLEFGFLSSLLDRPGRVRRFQQLTEEVWGTEHIGDVAQVHSVVKRLRRKLRTIGAPVHVQAVRGVGFRVTTARIAHLDHGSPTVVR